MMLPTGLGRRALLQALAGVVLVSTSRSAFGRARDEEAPDTRPGKANGEPGEVGGAKKVKAAVLTIVVTGKGQAIPQAEVKVKSPRGEERRPTNQAGEATFGSAGTGTAEVRVIVPGWESVLREVVLKEGPQRLTIELRSLLDDR